MSVAPVNIRMVFENILSNANKYTPANGKISVTLASTAHKVKVSVKDSGVGISKQDIPKLFYKFSRVNNPLTTTAGGGGLGLYWVKKLIDLHDASITVRSVVAKGTTLTISFSKDID